MRFIHLDQLPSEVKKKILPFMDQLLDLHQEKIISIFVYGSAAGSNYIPRVSNVNSVVVFREIDFETLKKSLKTVARGIKNRIVAPLFLTREYMESSVDVFPVEFLEMKEKHLLIYGEDVLQSLSIPEQYIRLFCEQQIKGKLIRIRQAYLEVGMKPKLIESLLRDSLNSLIPIFRNLIRLKEKTPSVAKFKILEQLCKEFQLDQNIFHSIHKHITREDPIERRKIDDFVGLYIVELEKLARVVNRAS